MRSILDRVRPPILTAAVIYLSTQNQPAVSLTICLLVLVELGIEICKQLR
jgi:hypothetical protein